MTDLLAARYEVQRLIGKGLTSSVFRGLDTETGQPVALKMLDPRLTWDNEALERLRREVVISRAIDHAGIVRVHDLVTDGDRAAVVQELVEGRSLGALVSAEGPLPLTRSIAIAMGVADALDACHRKGIIHRDVKPSNVLVDSNDRPKLIDFGIARVAMLTTVTHTGAILGSPEFQAPEILRGERPDLRCDLYGLGILLYLMLSGRAPFARDTADAPIFGQLSGRPKALPEARRDVPPALSALVTQLLDPEPDFRPEGAQEVLAALHDLSLLARSLEPTTACSTCGYRARYHVPFCVACGRFERINLRPGNWAVRLGSVDEPDRYIAHLGDLFGASLSDPVLREHLSSADSTRTLVRGVSEDSARSLAHDAGRFGGSPEVYLSRIPLDLHGSLNLTTGLLGLGGGVLMLFGTLNLAISLRNNMVRADGAFLAAFVCVGAMAVSIFRRSQPLIQHRLTQGPPKPDRLGRANEKLAQRVSAARPGALRRPFAMAIEAYWSASSRLLSLPQARPETQALLKAVDLLIDRVFTVQDQTSKLAVLLEGRSAADALQDLDRVRARIRVSGEAAGPLAEMEQSLRGEMEDLESAEDLVSSASGRLVLAAGAFRKTARLLATKRVPPPESLLDAIEEGEEELTRLGSLLGIVQTRAASRPPVPTGKGST